HYGFHAYRTFELSDWYTTNIDFGILSTLVPANKDAYNALPAQYRKLLHDSVVPSLDFQITEYAKSQSAALAAFNKKGLKPITYNAKELAEFRAVAGEPVWKDWVAAMNKKGYPGQEILDAVLASTKKM
ncbi:MAG: C4-dicarboxylate ABC transporter substrate-binding protein, partial [Alphaproteobacteria bacterium]